MKTLRASLAAVAAILVASAAQAGGGYERYGYGASDPYSGYGATTYSAPGYGSGGTVDLGPIERVQPHLNHTKRAVHAPSTSYTPQTTYTASDTVYHSPRVRYAPRDRVVLHSRPLHPAPIAGVAYPRRSAPATYGTVMAPDPAPIFISPPGYEPPRYEAPRYELTPDNPYTTLPSPPDCVPPASAQGSATFLSPPVCSTPKHGGGYGSRPYYRPAQTGWRY